MLVLTGVLGRSSGLPTAQAAVGDAGYRDYSYGTGTSAPTAKEVQSKLWFNDGSWWGVLFTPNGGKFQIYRLDSATQKWINTNVTVDARGTVRNDVLWDGTHLYVASAGTNETTASHAPKVRRFSYTPGSKSYSLDKGFPVSVDTGGGMQAFVIDKDSTGTLWGTYTRQSKVWATHTTGGDTTWVTPTVMPSSGATTIKAEDESGVVAYNGHIGIMWSNQNDGTYYWAVHDDGAPDTAWQVAAADHGTAATDNHINLKALNNDSAGQVFAAVKTSLSNPLDAPLYELLVLGNDGVWRKYVYGRVMDNHTRGTVAIDQQNRRIYMAAASPCCNGGVVYYKVSSLDNVSFPVGLGTPLIKSATDTHINNVTSTKQTLSSATGLAMIAGDDTSRFYLHNQFGLGSGDTVPPETTIDSGPSGTAYTSAASFAFSSNEAGATFSCSLDSGPFSACTAPQTYTGLVDGAHTFQVRATDLAGNTDPTPASRTWTIDTTNQSVVALPNADAEVDQATPDTNLGTRTSITVDGSPSSEGYVRFAVNVTGSILDARLRLYATDGTLDGPAVYSAGNTWTETGITWNTRPARAGSVIDDAAGIASNSWTEYNVTPAVTASGTYTFELAATSDDGVVWSSREAASNTPQLVLTVKPDTTPPDTTIDSGPTGVTNSTSATFAFSSSEAGSTFQCSLDNAAFAACTSPTTYSALGEGDHVFAARAIDGAGNVDPTPATRNWSIDSTPPAPPSITSPADNSTSANAVLTVLGTAEPTATVDLSSDGTVVGTSSADATGAWTITTSALVDGQHSLTAAATDTAGNKSTSSPAVHVTVDTGAPQTTIDSGPTGSTSSATATFTFSADDPSATFECSLDSGTFASCASPKTYTVAEGTHTFQVRARDAAGNVDATPAARTWSVDLTPPTVQSVSPADGAVDVQTSTNVAATFSEAMDPASVTSSSFTLAVTGGASVAASVTYDAATRTATLDPSAALLPATSYTATLPTGSGGVTDAAGNPLAATVSWSFTTAVAADTTPPDTTIDSGPTGPTASTSATFTFSATEPSTFECALDGGAYGSCTSPKSYSALSQGMHSFAVRATDGAGNTDPSPATQSWIVDTVAPASPTISSPSDNSTQTSSSFVVSGTAEGGAAVKLLEGAAQAATVTADAGGAWQTTLTSVADGSHTYTATASDAAGNTSTASAAVHVTVDTAAPDTTITSGPGGPTASTSATFAFSSTETGSTFACSLDSAAFTSCTSPVSYTSLGQGAHNFKVRATDAAGNVDATPASRDWTVDTVAPAAPTITSPADNSSSTQASINISGTAEAGATVQLFDGTSALTTTTASGAGTWSTTATLADGQHTLTAKAVDAAGNTSDASAAVHVTVAATAPETTITGGPSGTTTSTSATFTFTSDKSGATFSCSLDGAPFTPCTSPTSYTGLSEAQHTFQVRATDQFGNTDATPASATWTVSFTVFSDDFESGGLSKWSVVTGADGSATVQSAIVKSGAFAARFSETANTGSLAYARKSLGNLTDVTLKGDFQILQEGASGGNVPIFRLFDSAGTRIVSLFRQNASQDKVQVSYGGTIYVTTGRLPLNTWGTLELHVIVVGAGTSTVEVRLNGTVVYSSTVANVGTLPIGSMQIGNETAKQTFTLVTDNITARVPPS